MPSDGKDTTGLLPSRPSPSMMPSCWSYLPRLPRARVGMEWLDDWYLGLECDSQPCPTPVIFSSTLTTLDSGARVAAQFTRCQVRFNGVLFTSVAGKRCPTPASGNCSPVGERRNIACPSSRDRDGFLQPLLHHTKERRWVMTNSRPASF